MARRSLPTTSTVREVDAFLETVAATPQRGKGGGRLIFAMDATASREPTWDQACGIQGRMFEEAAAIGDLRLQLCYYRGYRECRASRWYGKSDDVVRAMSAVRCAGGLTQIRRVLDHALKETDREPVSALVFVGDCVEEEIDGLCDRAARLGIKGVPAFLFHEGGDPVAARAFSEIARLSGGGLLQIRRRQRRRAPRAPQCGRGLRGGRPARARALRRWSGEARQAAHPPDRTGGLNATPRLRRDPASDCGPR